MYGGGIPPQGGKNLHPASAADEGNAKVDNAGPAEVGYSKGESATFRGSSDKGFVLDSGYKADDFRAGGMNVRNLDDISHDA